VPGARPRRQVQEQPRVSDGLHLAALGRLDVHQGLGDKSLLVVTGVPRAEWTAPASALGLG
jgi:hypothetical protein